MISVIIPTLNSAREMRRTLPPLVEGVSYGIVKQVIIADGGSSDETLEIADAAGCEVVTTEPRRALQVRSGAAASKGKYIMILHPGVELAPGWVGEAERFIRSDQARARAGVFQLAFDDASPETKRALFWARLRARVMKLPYGEQGVLMSRFFYDGLGGYPDQASMDDVEFARRIGAKRWVWFNSEAVVSGDALRRQGKRGPLTKLTLLARHMMGADPIELAKAYD